MEIPKRKKKEVTALIKNNKGKIAAGTGFSGIVIALLLNFGTISDELQEWFYMAKGETSKPSSLENVSDAKYSDKSDYFPKQSSKK